MTQTPLLHLEGITRVYPSRLGSRTVLDIARLDIHEGEVLGIMGHNGCGKSTLLRILALLEAPDSGTLLFAGKPAEVENLSIRRQITLLLQTPYLLSRSVYANVAYGLELRGALSATERQKRVDSALRTVGLDPAVFLTRRRHELSGGEAQRVALAARLALRPRILLMDEPTSSVDEHSARRIALAARQAADAGSAVVVVSHDRDWLFGMASRILTLQEGKIRLSAKQGDLVASASL